MRGYAREQFVREFVDLMDQGQAALFCGAGTSIPVGMKDWRSLLAGISGTLKLKVEFVSDLVELAQFNFNERGTRNEIHELIMNEYGRIAAPGPLHDHLIRLPIDTIWTTNYDTVIESTYRSNGMRPDVKITPGSLAAHPRLWDVQIFKMHGDVGSADDAVLTKSDYDIYPYTPRGRAFLSALEVSLTSRTFLFLGFSFNDPNVERVLSGLSAIPGHWQRTQYCVMKRPAAPIEGPERGRMEHEYRLTELRINDWKRRFAIETILVDEYEDIPTLLADLARASRRNHVFVAAAAHDFDPLGEDRLSSLARDIGRRLARTEKFLISGFGIGVGQDVVQGYFDEAYAHEPRDLTDRAILRPFPQRLAGDESDRKAQWTRYRNDMIRQAGYVIYLAGNKLENGATVPSSGMLEEFAISKRFDAIPIPIGMTGSVAAVLWHEVRKSPERYYGNAKVEAYLDTLGDHASTNEQLVQAVFSMMHCVSHTDEARLGLNETTL